MTAKDILDRLEKRYVLPEWQFVRELRCGTSPGRWVGARLDAWAISAWQSKAWRRMTFEVKVSKGDFAAELKEPIKRRAGLMLSNLFYFVAPEGVIDPAKVPVECGLVEVWKGRYGLELRKKVPAPWRDSRPPSWAFVASLVRRLVKEGKA